MINRFAKLFIVIFCFIFVPNMVLAADPVIDKGSLVKPLPPATAEQIETALKISEECTKYKHSMNNYDCDCVGMTALKMLRAAPNTLYPQLVINAQLACPNTVGVAGTTYELCLDWAPKKVGEEYKAFCTCYANTYAGIYSKNPSDSPILREKNMIKALSICRIGDFSRKDYDHMTWIETLKKNGVYKTIFPDTD